LPGGGVDPGESVKDAAVREVQEVTGIHVEVGTPVGVYTKPRHVMAYDDGEVRQQFSLCFRAHIIGGPRATDAGRWSAACTHRPLSTVAEDRR
jgi:ADP-ribose pyrophosphatase YjhB (NUDIX family)